MRLLYLMILLLLCGPAMAQKKEEGFDFNFKPTDAIPPRYYVITEKKNDLWQREAWYLPEKTIAMEGAYKDEACTVPHGLFKWYHPTRYIRETGTYANGKKEGAWMRYSDAGLMTDSAWYEAGRLKGVGLSWHPNGMQSDSSNFDGNGKGVRISWFDDGAPSSAGYIINDTAKDGRWKYFHRNGTLMATEEYVRGESKNCRCYDEAGKELPAKDCEERDADFEDGERGWIRFVQRNLRADVPVRNKAPLGQYTVLMQFIVETDGTVSNIKAMTRFGYGMEEEVERMLKKAPRWTPAQQFGKKVKAYRLQPVTFVVQQG